MIFPAQTSMIPVQIALARFFEQNGISSFVQNYPYWYLGTTPFRFLTGPVLPLVLTAIRSFFPSLSLFEVMLWLVGVMWLVGGVGVYALVKELGERRLLAGSASFFYIFGPIIPFLFRFSDGLYLIAFSLLPFTLLVYLRLLRHWSRKQATLFVILASFLMLLDTSILPTFLLGVVAILLSVSGWKKIEERLKKTSLLLAASFVVVTFWYTPSYWLTLLGAPSFAGKSLFSIIIWLGKLIPLALAVSLAIFSGRFFREKRSFRDFCFYWLFFFGFLTLLRFLSNPSFWLDWSEYGVQIQLGFALLGSLLANRFCPNRRICLLSAFIPVFVLWLFVFSRYVTGTLQKDLSGTIEYQTGNELKGLVQPQELVFASGSTAFWLNSLFDVRQVRGGVDQVSLHPTWRQAAWEIREGEDVDRTIAWLGKLKISYVLVHASVSKEYYHDFRYPQKFEGSHTLRNVFSGDGDNIYRYQR
ncbi:MAG: hypothetical protein Q7S03_01485 [bacterium]|nr:hypothetical protein [bacterium]